MINIELWKDVIGYKQYLAISDIGRIKQKERHTKNNVIRAEKITYGTLDSNGYKRTSIIIDGIRTWLFIHRLVYQAFRGELLSNMEIDHKDHNRSNNNADNLQQVTHRVNSSKDQWRRGKTSKYVGVSLVSSNSSWKSQITINNKIISIGYFKTEEDAKVAYDDILNNPSNISNYRGKSRNMFKHYKHVIQRTNDNKYVRDYISTLEASAITGIDKSSIKKVCDGIRKLAGGFKFEYK